MQPIRIWATVLAAVLAVDASACDDLDEVLGYTLVAVTNVKGDFNGCEHDKLVEFENGWLLRCSEYSYSYSYNPKAFIFAKKLTYRGTDLMLIKACIDDEMYDMRQR